MEEHTRKYHLYERGLETMERKMLDSIKMQRLVARASAKYGVQFKVPDFRPVIISKRMNGNTIGRFCGDEIKISYHLYKKGRRHTLWHEVVHAFISDNFKLLLDARPKETWSTLHNPFEKDIFRMSINDGSHDSWNYKLTCTCGHWLKSIKKKNSMFCSRCQKYCVSPAEYKKIQKIANINSQIMRVDPTKYQPWKSNERIEN
jgi:hypothetical protein